MVVSIGIWYTGRHAAFRFRVEECLRLVQLLVGKYEGESSLG